MSNDQQPTDSYDVAILGGGLAGLTLGLSSSRQRPDTSIFIAEKREGPAREAAFKVGESTQEISCELLRERARLQGAPREGADHQERPALLVPRRRQQRPRRARRARPREPPAGPHLPARPRALRELPRRAGTCGRDRPRRQRPRPGRRARRRAARGHVHARRQGEHRRAEVKARWIVDASGRAFIAQAKARAARGQRTRDQLGLVPARRRARPRGLGRPQRRGVLRPHGRARRPQAQHQPRLRPGLLGLADPALLGTDLDRPLRRPPVPSRSRSSTRSTALLDWFRRNEPQIAESVEARGLDQVEDFLKVADFSYGCKQVFSGAIAGRSSARPARSSTRSTRRGRTSSRCPTR